jgi:hypothetical protein
MQLAQVTRSACRQVEKRFSDFVSLHTELAQVASDGEERLERERVRTPTAATGAFAQCRWAVGLTAAWRTAICPILS